MTKLATTSLTTWAKMGFTIMRDLLQSDNDHIFRKLVQINVTQIDV